MNKLNIYMVATALFLSACASDENNKNPKDIPVDTGAQPQSDIIVSAPPGTLGHGRF